MSNQKDIATISRTQEILKKYDFHIKKNFGQNFLIDLNILQKIVSSAVITSSTNVIEIGPGIGSLTEQLAKQAKHVLAVEIDRTLIPILKDTLSDYSNVTVINADVLEVDLMSVINETFEDLEDIILVANLPYYITTPILMKLMTSTLPIKRYCVMVQKEVAERLCGEPGTKAYNALTVMTQYYTEPRIAFVVPNTVFIPKPQVESAVLVLEKREHPMVEVKDETFFFQVLKGSFIQRRKTLYNNLKQALKNVLTPENIMKGLEESGIDPQIRGEKLSIEDFARLSDHLLKYKV